MTGMKLGISNLAWSATDEPAAMALLAEAGVAGIEVAPTRVAPWPELTAERLAAFRGTCAAHGLCVSSLQAIFYQVPEATLLAGADGFAVMCEHMRRIGAVAEALGAGVAVFGAPRNRVRGALSPADAMDLAAARLAILGDIAAASGLCIGVEAVPEYYKSDFLTRPEEVVSLVSRCGHPAIRAHVDIACATLGGCDPAAAVRMSNPVHYHIAEAALVALRSPVYDHVGTAAALHENRYDGWAVIEMLEDRQDALGAVAASVAYAQSVYFG